MLAIFSQADTCIVINATGIVVDNATADSCIITPIRPSSSPPNTLLYDNLSGEITWAVTPAAGATDVNGLSDGKVVATSSYFIGGGGGSASAGMNTCFGYEAGNVIGSQTYNTYIGGACARYNNTGAMKLCSWSRSTKTTKW